MWSNTDVIKLLEIEHPIIQAPMAGASSPQLVASVSNAGALGSFGAAATPPDQLRATIRAIREQTDRSFNINLFCADTENFDRSARPGPKLVGRLQTYHNQYNLGKIPDPEPMFGPADAQLEVLCEEAIPVISFHFGIDKATVDRAHQSGAKILCTATTVEEAKILEQAGVDAIIAQGTEAGGHRGTFTIDYQEALIGILALVPQIVDAVSVPVIAAGGIMDARGLVASLALGSSAVQMGTAFLGCTETPIAKTWLESLKSADAEATVVTTAISGKPARGIRNRYIDEIESLDEPLLPYPAQYSISRKLRKAAAENDDPSFMSMWAGQGVGLFQEQTASDLVNQLVSDSERLIKQLANAE